MGKDNQGRYGIDKQSIGDFEADLSSHLYRVWNRLSSGSYYPPGVKGVDIPMRGGKTRQGASTTVGVA